MQNIFEIEELIKLISRLPGLGPKSAKRIVLKLINSRDELIKPMAKSLAEVYKNISRCKICGSLKTTSIECTFTDCQIVKKNISRWLISTRLPGLQLEWKPGKPGPAKCMQGSHGTGHPDNGVKISFFQIGNQSVGTVM